MPHDHDHLVGRLAGEGADHPRQRIVHWLREEGRTGEIARFNDLYEQSLGRHREKEYFGRESFASYEAFGHLVGQVGDPETDIIWAAIVGPSTVGDGSGAPP